MAVSQEILDEIALSRDEYDLIVQKLEREPNGVELGLFGALWSEHCGYKHSKPLLRMFPTTGAAVRVQAGEENAGVVDIGDGLSVVFKIESHNHPSVVEPYEGAATGVGGIVRDILAMGARPVALLNSLRFGPLDTARNRYLFQGVVAGISGYGNCIGVPDVGGEVVFAPSYAGNPLVNAMCVGLLPAGGLMRAAAANPGSVLMVVGSATGRDGIHGASGLASRTFEDEREMRPTVQVGDPFLEKVLIEACLEAAASGWLDGLQDMGAAGLTSSVMECAARGGTGVEIDVALVPRREGGMSAYEVMLSESQERMLLIVAPGRERDVAAIFEKWDLHVVAIGKVTSDGWRGSTTTGCSSRRLMSTRWLTHRNTARHRAVRRTWMNCTPCRCPPCLRLKMGGRILRTLLASPNITSKRAVFRRYDHEVQTRTVVRPGAGDAAVLRLRESQRGLALAVDGNGRLAYLDPYTGGALAVAEACRNVAVSGAAPLAVTNCLNFGNPQKPEVYYQLQECIRGMADACRALGVPVVSGNVSLYNETQGEAIYPTPVVGAVGLLEDVGDALRRGVHRSGRRGAVAWAGRPGIAARASREVSTWRSSMGIVGGKPVIDLESEARLQRLLVRLAQARLLHSAHDCSDGGLAVALSESAILGGVGFAGEGDWIGARWDAALFGEEASRAVVSCNAADVPAIESAAQETGVPCARLGVTGGERFAVPGLVDEALAELSDAFYGGLEQALSS